MLRNDPDSWGAPAKLFHWVMALLIFAQIALGLTAVAWHISPTKLDLFVWHKSTGMLILALLALRSEEHTSELQSRRDLVCRLLLEKKKKTSHLHPSNAY